MVGFHTPKLFSVFATRKEREASGNIAAESGVQYLMNPNRWLEIAAVPLASLFLILILVVFGIQRPPSTGILIPMMKVRPEPLSNCSFAAFTIYLRSDGTLGGGSRDQTVSWHEATSRLRQAAAEVGIRDNTVYLIADGETHYKYVFKLVSDIHATAPTVHIALVTSSGQVSGIDGHGPYPNRCQFVWSSVKEVAEEPSQETTRLLGGHFSTRRSLLGGR
jgi:biopolymer transport protein ExbD